jgi:hypothetical protein
MIPIRSIVISAFTMPSLSIQSYDGLKMLPSLVVFDLDNTLWTPELYQLRKRENQYPVAHKDVQLFPAANEIIQQVKNNRLRKYNQSGGGDEGEEREVEVGSFSKIKFAVASRIDDFGPPIDVTVSHWERLQYVRGEDSSRDDTIRALCQEVLSAIREVAQMNALFREQVVCVPKKSAPLALILVPLLTTSNNRKILINNRNTNNKHSTLDTRYSTCHNPRL